MKVFISWSGERSRLLGEALREWLPAVIQRVRPYFTPDDIAKGSRWANEIAGELEDSKIGLICITRENLLAPWIMFEAGALSKCTTAAHVCPLLFGVRPSDMQGPLVQFQAGQFSKVEMHRVVKMINAQLGGEKLEDPILNSVFDKWWPDLEGKVQGVLSQETEPRKDIRTDRELLEDILNQLRANALSIPAMAQHFMMVTRNLGRHHAPTTAPITNCQLDWLSLIRAHPHALSASDLAREYRARHGDEPTSQQSGELDILVRNGWIHKRDDGDGVRYHLALPMSELPGTPSSL
jgi:hypothetical protein